MSLDAQDLVILPLVRIDFPELTVGYHLGLRDFEYGGLVYRPNKYLDPAGFSAQLGNEIGTRQIVFSGVPDVDDPLAQINNYTWKRAPVTVTFLAGEAGANEPLGVVDTQFYRIHAIKPSKSAIDAGGKRMATIAIDLRPPDERVVGQTFAKASNEDQQFDNAEGDTIFADVAVEATWERKFGQRTQ